MLACGLGDDTEQEWYWISCCENGSRRSARMVKEAPSDATKDLIWSVQSEYEILGCMTCRVSSTKDLSGLSSLRAKHYHI